MTTTKDKKDLDGQIQMHRIIRIPDSSCWRSQAVAGGDVRSAAFTGCEGLVRQVAHMEAGSVSAEICFVFDPVCEGCDMKSRLQPYLRVQASDDSMAKAMCMLIERGQISRFYELQGLYRPLELPKSLSVSCDVIRRRDFIKPQHTCEFNARIPDWYLTVSPFSANEKNDFRTLDRVLDRVQEPVVISVRIAPADISPERRALTSLMERYRSVNRSRSLDEDDYAGLDSMGGDGYRHLSYRCKVSPFSLEDPIAEDAWRCLRPIHESMCYRPHLYFSIRIMAVTEATARVVAGVFAEDAFEKGDYRLVVSRKGVPLFDETAENGQRSAITPLPIHRYLSQERQGQDCRHLSRLVQLATVDELSGAFRLPVASSYGPVLCLRKTTDPVYEDPKELIVIGGHEQDIEGNPNAIVVGIGKDYARY
jgi:hypothetical protein